MTEKSEKREQMKANEPPSAADPTTQSSGQTRDPVPVKESTFWSGDTTITVKEFEPTAPSRPLPLASLMELPAPVECPRCNILVTTRTEDVAGSQVG
jgi:hypothetical protein